MSSIEKQVDGTHYSKLELQPVQLAYMLNASPCFCKLAKYLTRDKDDRLIQLDKAIHCIELERDLIEKDNYYGAYTRGDAELMQYEITKIAPDLCIKKFVSQFNFPNSTYHALLAMFICDYDEAIANVEEIKLKVINLRG